MVSRTTDMRERVRPRAASGPSPESAEAAPSDEQLDMATSEYAMRALTFRNVRRRPPTWALR